MSKINKNLSLAIKEIANKKNKKKIKNLYIFKEKTLTKDWLFFFVNKAETSLQIIIANAPVGAHIMVIKDNNVIMIEYSDCDNNLAITI